MKNILQKHGLGQFRQAHRKGVFFVLAVICLMGAMTFVGMSVDLGMITLTKTRMQTAADSAALSAAQEIVLAVRRASWNSATGLDMAAVQATAATDARAMAVYVANLNGFYIDSSIDVTLGRRLLAADGVSYTQTWGVGPYNCVQVSIRKNNSNSTAPDAKMPLIFASVVGQAAQSITTSATAFIESRDIVCTLDYSASMNDDSCMSSATISRLTKSAVESNLDAIWAALVASDVRFSNDASSQKFPSIGFGLMNSAAGTYNSSSTSQTVIEALDLYTPAQKYYDTWTLTVVSGDDYYTLTSGGYDWRRYIDTGTGTYAGKLRRAITKKSTFTTVADTTAPGYFAPIPESAVSFPQEGKNTSTGLRFGKPSIATSKAQWLGYVDYVRTDSNLNTQGYRQKYGYRTLCVYLMESRPSNSLSEDLWRAPCYPFHGMKMGMNTFCQFMTELSYGDHIGLVDYAVDARVETGLTEDGADVIVNLGTDLMSTRYSDIDTIQQHKQAAHYSANTATGDGLLKAVGLLNSNSRYGTQKAILLMTDGVPNISPSGFSLPSTWNWNTLLDYDGNGTADYTTTNQDAQYALYQAKLAADQNIVIHTLCLGAGADTTLLKAIAKISGGYDIVVPAGTSVTAQTDLLRVAFGVLAGQVPPARLVVNP
ncbi:MAG: VWA domain-containing protein [Planctomycetales bacterium]|nr:VWA domain-containing protein [Planctomycetales bacterium]